MDTYKETELKNSRRITKTVTAMCVTVLAFLLMLIGLLAAIGVRHEEYIRPDNCVVTVDRQDGDSDYYVGTRFDSLNDGDVARMQLNIPDDIKTDVPMASLYFEAYNCAVKVISDGKVIYLSGWEDVETGQPTVFIGNRSHMIPLITDEINLAGRILTIELYSVANRAVSSIDPIIVPSDDVWKVSIINSRVLFVCLITISVICILMTIYSATRSLFNRTADIGIGLFPIVLCFSVWSLGSRNMLHVLSQNLFFNSRAEYYALIVMPIFIAALGTIIFKRGIINKIWIGCLILFTAFFIITMAAYFLIDEFSPQFVLRGLLLLMILEIGFFVYGLFKDKNIRACTSTYIMRVGCIAMLLLAMLEVARYQIVFFSENSAIAEFSIGNYSSLLFATVAILYYVIYNMETQTTIIERQQLEAIAFRDTLTNIPNRSYFNQKIDELEEQNQKDYTLVFIDLNDLKKANDQFGHDMGDRLLIAAAECMTKAFSREGIYCRWGGDEFVALILGPQMIGEECINTFIKALDQLNEHERFPFRVSAAHGVVVSTSRNYIVPNKAIREADIRMYENKQKMKKPDSEI